VKRGERNAVVVADAGPLIGLAKIGSIELLHRLFGSVLIPEAVAAELHLDTPLPGALALNLARKQGWLKIQEVSAVPRRLLETVDRGEAEAITLASSRHARLLIDERIGRAAAKAEGVTIFGTGAVLIKAKQAGLITSVRTELKALTDYGYRLSDALQRELLRLVHEIK
jgi:predicted nucleic acid-binding protein